MNLETGGPAGASATLRETQRERLARTEPDVAVSVSPGLPTFRYGWTKVQIRPDVVDEAAIELFGFGLCVPLAVALHEQTGHPFAVFDRYDGKEGWKWLHACLQQPDGTLLDIYGVRTVEQVRQELSELCRAQIRLRPLSDVWELRKELSVADTLGDDWWITEPGFPVEFGDIVVRPLARAVLRASDKTPAH